MNKVSRVTAVEIEGVKYLSLEIDMDILELFDLQNGELLDTKIEGNSIILTKTGIIGVVGDDT